MTDSRQIIEPEFYKDFHCIAGDCSFTCCKEWKIRVDEGTKKRWQKLPEPVVDAITEQDGQEIIELLPNMRCPFLEENQLCRLVRTYGEACLSETCHVFPRETHTFKHRIERTLVSCCPEIVDRLYAAQELHFTGLPYRDRDFLLKGQDKLFQIRNILMYWLSDQKLSNEVNLKRCFFMLLDLFQKEHAAPHRAARRKHAVCDEMYALDPGECLKDADVQKLTATILAMPKDAEASMNEQNALFLDISENYRKEGRYQELLTPLYTEAVKLSRQLEKRNASMLQSLFKCHEEVHRLYAPLLRNYLAAETFATLLIPGCTLRDMVLQFEWMIMEYALILHAMVLATLAMGTSGRSENETVDENHWEIRADAAITPLPYENARDVLILVARMTGYDGDEIEDYLQKSFEDPVWPWGYADFLLG